MTECGLFRYCEALSLVTIREMSSMKHIADG